MANRLDYSVLDTRELLQFVFYPRRDWATPPPRATDHMVPVEAGIEVSCRYYPADSKAPALLYFHGNGEVACAYDGIAPFYNEIGISLFVADYRGYGRSGGTPTFSNTAADAYPIYRYFRKMLDAGGHTGRVFIMGRSLGSQSAIELAANCQDEVSGLVIESGFAQQSRLLMYLGVSVALDGLDEFDALALKRIRGITLPVLIIHGEFDTIIPHSEAVMLHNCLGSKDKKLVTIPGADHNHVMIAGIAEYFGALREFVFANHGGG